MQGKARGRKARQLSPRAAYFPAEPRPLDLLALNHDPQRFHFAVEVAALEVEDFGGAD